MRGWRWWAVVLLALLLLGTPGAARGQTTFFCDTWVTGVSASGAALTVTLPVVALQSHYLCSLEIRQYAAAALTGGATPVTVTSTNLNGSPAWTFQTALAIGVSEAQIMRGTTMKSLSPGVATTIVAPATTNVIWRINVLYKVAP